MKQKQTSAKRWHQSNIVAMERMVRTVRMCQARLNPNDPMVGSFRELEEHIQGVLEDSEYQVNVRDWNEGA